MKLHITPGNFRLQKQGISQNWKFHKVEINTSGSHHSGQIQTLNTQIWKLCMQQLASLVSNMWPGLDGWSINYCRRCFLSAVLKVSLRLGVGSKPVIWFLFSGICCICIMWTFALLHHYIYSFGRKCYSSDLCLCWLVWEGKEVTNWEPIPVHCNHSSFIFNKLSFLSSGTSKLNECAFGLLKWLLLITLPGHLWWPRLLSLPIRELLKIKCDKLL